MIPLRTLPVRDSPAYHELVSRRRPTASDMHLVVAKILAEVRAGGDAALLDLTERFDRVRIPETSVPEAAWRAALEALDGRVRDALTEASRRIEAVHQAQVFREEAVTVAPGVRVWREWRPFRRVGLYAPGGRTVYPSSVLMMAIPARIARCAEIVLCSPPQRDGRVAPAILAAAAMVRRILGSVSAGTLASVSWKAIVHPLARASRSHSARIRR